MQAHTVNDAELGVLEVLWERDVFARGGRTLVTTFGD
jgi:hypothetical protein